MDATPDPALDACKGKSLPWQMPLVHGASIVVTVPSHNLKSPSTVREFIAKVLPVALKALQVMTGPSFFPVTSLGADRMWRTRLSPKVIFETKVPEFVEGDAAGTIATAVFLAKQELAEVGEVSPSMVRLYQAREDPRSSTTMWVMRDKDQPTFARVLSALCSNSSTIKLTFLLGGRNAGTATTGGRSTSRPVSGRKQARKRSRSRAAARCNAATLAGGRCKHSARPGTKTCAAHGRR
jgi:hypothetical protein